MIVVAEQLRRALERLGPVDVVRVDPLVHAIALSTHDPELGLWRAIVVTTAAGEPTVPGDAEGVTVSRSELLRAVERRRSTLTRVRAGRDAVTVDADRVPRVDDLPRPPASEDAAEVELVLPDAGPAVVDVRDETRLVMDPELVTEFRAAGPVQTRAFTVDGRWYVRAATGRDVTSTPVLVAEVASYAEGTE